ncbi:Sensory box histidine kinase/response regulator [Dissulfuribacter thermophilus]|uniref:histidine kinase n=1 Tax=Dissulfuribacter thermophilus TaxID=1156395 RepID=A0A1B9F350_9BACT|nr:ATP-binding protein [Dissulfuribacter thermophilus]OCC14245.1 Sensory box histidine kinase/response regulator [Dissulfuribacter thermophilus]
MGRKINIRIKILVGLVAILMSFWVSFLSWTYLQDKRLSIRELDHQALGIYHYIVLSRRWIAKQAGIFIKEGEDSYALLTPTEFTRELADYSQRILPFSIDISIAETDNPEFQPGEFEKKAMQAFSSGAVSHTWTIYEKKNGEKEFWFVAPLYFTNECNSCHVKSNEIIKKAVFGCISIKLPAEKILSSIKQRFLTNLFLFLTTLFLAVVFLWAMLTKLVLTPLDKLSQIAQKVREGDLKARVKIGVSPEWESVAESFNDMITAIEEQNVRLEKAVEDAVSRLKITNEELKKANAYKSAFFSNITHDLKTPITAIKGASEILAKKLQGNPQLLSYVDIIARNVQKLSKMVQDLLICAKLESGRSDLHFEENNICEVIEDSILMLMPIAWDKEVKIHYSVPEKPVLVKSDRAMIDQLFTNLISNAIKFSPKGETVDVTLEVMENKCKIFVEDAGPGIPEDDWEKVFQKFYRAKGATSQEGMGLGLAISKFIVDAHKGEIRVSRSKRGGTLVTVTLPIKSSEHF